MYARYVPEKPIAAATNGNDDNTTGKKRKRPGAVQSDISIAHHAKPSKKAKEGKHYSDDKDLQRTEPTLRGSSDGQVDGIVNSLRPVFEEDIEAREKTSPVKNRSKSKNGRHDRDDGGGDSGASRSKRDSKEKQGLHSDTGGIPHEKSKTRGAGAVPTADSEPDPITKKKDSTNGRDNETAQAKQRNLQIEELEEKAKQNAAISGDETTQAREASKHKSIYAKYDRSTSMAQKSAKDDDTYLADEVQQDTGAEEPSNLKGLEPFPQQEHVITPAFEPNFSALPSWLTEPITASSNQRVAFKSLQLAPRTIETLHNKGYVEAFAVQAAVLPLVLPGPSQHPGDLCVSAATGSGKTLAYALPIIESLRTRVVTRLRALIVVPTRELVTQVREVCELCASGSTVRIGTAVGNRPLAAERDLLVSKEQHYSPAEYDHLQHYSSLDDDQTDSQVLDEDFDDDDGPPLLPAHVRRYTSKIDILIATPGRLVDHIKSTPGFSLDHVEWLIIDEADRLLSQSFQDWLSILSEVLDSDKPHEGISREQRLLADIGCAAPKLQTRKIVLSATMTRDLEKLSALKLRRPKLVTVHNATPKTLHDKLGDDAAHNEITGNSVEHGDTYSLPPLLEESAIPIGDGSEKPLYLWKLLRTKIDPGPTTSLQDHPLPQTQTSLEPTSNSEDSDNLSTSVSSSTTSSSASNLEKSKMSSEHGASTVLQSAPSKGLIPRGVLIFTRSNESALRLSRLLALLEPSYASQIGTLTSTHRSTERRLTLRQFASSQLSILIASDLVSRGMDIPNLAHIVNYDVPSSLKSYVHRVGRTARADKEGNAWTLVTEREAAWFWREIARSTKVQRGNGQKVHRTRVEVTADEEERAIYENSLKVLAKEVRE
ncbi:MAG: Type I transmembrane sorting receptor [Chaenotheca gracillima]|nr:MAG: Type I transmembrane sorting receptor [Chaenotheca gracillima]